MRYLNKGGYLDFRVILKADSMTSWNLKMHSRLFFGLAKSRLRCFYDRNGVTPVTGVDGVRATPCTRILEISVCNNVTGIEHTSNCVHRTRVIIRMFLICGSIVCEDLSLLHIQLSDTY